MSQPAALVEAEKIIASYFKSETPAETPEAAKPENTPAESSEAKSEEAGSSAPAETPAPESAPEDWKHKYDVLNGKFKKEVPALHQKLKDLEAKLTSVETAQQSASTPQQVQAANSAKSELSAALEKLQNEYGQEFIDHQRLLARAEAESLIEEKMKPFADRLNGVAQTTQQVAEERYMSELNEKAKGWEEKKDNESFHEYLAEVDPFSGIRRFDLMKDAMLRGDAGRVAAFYNAFDPAPQSSPKPSVPKPDKNKLVAPASAPTGNINRTEPPDTTTIKSSDLARFARDVIAGKYRGRDAEMKALQQKYDTAQATGKIVMD